MPEPTLQELSARLVVVEQKLSSLTATIPLTRDWRSVIGISEDNEFTRAMRAEIEANRAAERS